MGDRLPLESRDMNVLSESDSDSSDADSPPKIRKTRSTRSVRSILASNPTTVPPVLPKKQVSVYSTRVTKCLEDLKSGRLQLCIDKDEEETPIVEKPKQDVKTDRRVPSITLDDSKDDLDCTNLTTPESSFVRSRSPTPPPTPDSIVTQKPTRTRRMNRHMKKALRTLEGMKDTIRVEHSSSEDDDLVLVGHLSSPAPETTSMTAKIRYKSKIFKYSMMKADTFQSIKTRLAGDIEEEEDHLFFMVADRNILPTDTPISISLHIADIIDCHLYSPGMLDMGEDIPARDAVSLYVQCSNRKNKILIKVNKHQALRKLMSSYATKVKTELSYLKFMFDGEDILPSMTPEELEMEDMDTIDAIEV
ncbi:NFATC2-interacting protein-like isoform X2 [Haliotis rufescens]|uniref:NFATC2-interacting protein-like isoform X2 n=1 Tax=Haliotis rufescens TaxID=6454 RepID=UPI00201EDC89|nr:NFATC2-interacting protein-like isoform X2 [Haliotis rufescens]